ncbi:14018_t:CDS:2, partial [Racocetra persica]
MKTYNRYKVYSKCQCDYFDLSLICKYCDINCIRSYTRWSDEYLLSDIIGLFEFGTYRFLEDSDNNNISEDINELQLDDMKRMIEIHEQELIYEQVVLDKNKILANWFTIPTNAEKVINDKQKFLKKYKGKRFWHLLTFYYYKPSGAEKSEWFLELFHDKLYDKPKKQQTNSSYWNRYIGQKIVLINKFYTKIDWNKMINLLNDSCFEVEHKYGEFEPFLAKYICLTATKLPEEAYNFRQYGGEDDNKKDYNQFKCRLDYIIRFDEKWNDDQKKKTTQIIFEKEDEDKFRNMLWDVKYRNGENSIEEIIEKFKKINMRIEREEIIIEIEDIFIESIKRLEKIIKEKDIIIQDTVNQYKKISQNTISYNRFSEYNSNDSGYNSYDEYEELMRDIHKVTSED